MHDGHDIGAACDHSQGHSHTHSHLDECGHEHDHGHEHVHAPGSQDESEPGAYARKLLVVLGYMLEHNKSHAEEIGDLAEQLELLGYTDAAELLDDSADDMSMSIVSLQDAISELTMALDEQDKITD